MRDLAVGRRAIAAAAVAALAGSPALPAGAWCGERFPSWAFYLKWDENPSVPFEFGGAKGVTSYRIVGAQSSAGLCGVLAPSGRLARVTPPQATPRESDRPASRPSSSAARPAWDTSTSRILRRLP